MSVTVNDIQERAREALSYFEDARGKAGDPTVGSDESDISRSDLPTWVLQIEEAARGEVGARWEETHFYGMVIETLRDAEEYGEHDWEEDDIEPQELIDELSSDVSVSAFNEELVEWSRESSHWTDVSDDLGNYHTGDSEVELELLPEAMGDDIRRIRHAVLEIIYEQLLEEQRRESPESS